MTDLLLDTAVEFHRVLQPCPRYEDLARRDEGSDPCGDMERRYLARPFTFLIPPLVWIGVQSPES